MLILSGSDSLNTIVIMHCSITFEQKPRVYSVFKIAILFALIWMDYGVKSEHSNTSINGDIH